MLKIKSFFSYLKRINILKRRYLFIISFLFSFLMYNNVFSLTLSRVNIKIIPEYLGFQSDLNKNEIVHAKVIINGWFNGDLKNNKEPLKLFLPKEARLDSIFQINDEGRYKKLDYIIKKEKGTKILSFRLTGKRFIVNYFIFPTKKNSDIKLDYTFYSPNHVDLLNIEIVDPIFVSNFNISKGASVPDKEFKKNTGDVGSSIFEFRKVDKGKKINFGVVYSVDMTEREKRLDLYGMGFPAFVYGSVISYKGYSIALQISNILEMVSCYCGCGQFGHTSLRDCFFRYDGTLNDHASGCDICNIEAKDVDRLNKQGFSLKDIRMGIDSKYGIYGKGTPTPPII